MIIPLAVAGLAKAGLTKGVLAAAGKHAAEAACALPALEIALSGNLHDMGSFATGKSNKLGKLFQRSAIADAIIAAKKSTEGQVFANRKATGATLYAAQPLKAVTVHEANLTVGSLPDIITKGIKLPNGKQFGGIFDGNKLKVGKIKTALSGANKIDRLAFGAQVGLPTLAAGKQYQLERERGKGQGESLKAGLEAGAVNAAITAPLIGLSRQIIFSPAAAAHKALSNDGEYGYKLLEEASVHAKKSLDRPKLLNYSRYMYTTPEKNVNGIPGRIFGDGLKKVFGQKTIKGYNQEVGYFYNKNEKADDTPYEWTVKKVKHGIRRLDNILSGNLAK